jgi:hypothetical protein
VGSTHTDSGKSLLGAVGGRVEGDYGLWVWGSSMLNGVRGMVSRGLRAVSR